MSQFCWHHQNTIKTMQIENTIKSVKKFKKAEVCTFCYDYIFEFLFLAYPFTGIR